MDRIAKTRVKSEHLSQEELKARLFLKLKEDGTFNGFRALLRNELVKHLYLIDPQKVVFQLPKVQSDEELLVRYPLEATNWLISEHFMRNHYDFTLSVFALESGMPSNRQNLSIGDILSFLHIDQSSEIGHKIVSSYKAKEDRLFLWTLLTANRANFSLSKEASESQTELPEEEDLKRIKEKLQKVDDVYNYRKHALRSEERNNGHSLAQLEQILRAPAPPHGALELHRLRDIDLESVYESKLREYRGEVDRLRRTLAEQQDLKLQSLIERERNVHENLEKQKTTIENEFFGQRQKMLLEIAKQEQREEEWKNKKSFQEKKMQIEMQRMESIKKAIEIREECLNEQENAHENWLAEQKQKIEAINSKKYDEKQRELDYREMELRGLQERLDAKESTLKEKESSHEKDVRDTNQIKFDLANAIEKIKALQDENASLQIHANATAENMRLKAELHRLQLLSKEAIARNETDQMRHNTMLQDFLDRLAKPSPQALFLQQELEKLREQYQKESEVWYKQKAILENAVYKARSQQKTYLDRIKMQSRQIDILQQTIDDLQCGILRKNSDLQIHQKHVTFKPALPIVRSNREAAFTLRETPTIDLHGTYFDTSLNPSHLPPELELGVSGLLTDSCDIQYDTEYTGLLFSGGSFDETRARIKHLEEEAELLERTFKSLHLNPGRSGFLNRHVPQMFVPDTSNFSGIDQTYCTPDVGRNRQTSSHQEESNLEDFSQHVSSSTPNESSVANTTRPDPFRQSFTLKESDINGSMSNEHSKELKQKMAKHPNRRLSFELSDNDMNNTVDLKDSVVSRMVESRSMKRSENNDEVKLRGTVLSESNTILPSSVHETALSNIQDGDNTDVRKSKESIQNLVPINLDSAWKSTTLDLKYDLDNRPRTITASEEMQPHESSAPSKSEVELSPSIGARCVKKD